MIIYAHRYANARDVLPEELVKKLQSIHTGLVWVSAKKRRVIKSGDKKERNMKIIEIYSGGMSVSDIADEFFLSKERVRQIIKGGMKDGS